MSTHWLKPCSNPTALPAQPRARDRPPAIRFRDFPLPGIAQDPFPLASRQGVCMPHRFSKSSSCSASTQPPSAEQTRPLDPSLEVWWCSVEATRRPTRATDCYAASLPYSAHAWSVHVLVTFSLSRIRIGMSVYIFCRLYVMV